MVKNSGINQPTDMVRLGRYTDCEQPKNSIVFNASDDKIRDIKHSGLYISPLRNANASNLLAYDSITKEVVDIGGMQLKLADLQVKNLEVVNMKVVNEEHVYTPILTIGEGCSKNENVGLDIHGIKIINDKSTNTLRVNENTVFNGTIEASKFVGDGGLLSNVQYDLNVDIGEVVENLHVCRELKGDGGLLSNITVDQISNFNGYSPNFTEINASKDIHVGRSVYINNRIHTKGNINSDGNVVAKSFYGDGTTLSGVCTNVDLSQTNARVLELENQTARFEPLETSKSKIEKDVVDTRTRLENGLLRIEPLEIATTSLDERLTHTEPILKNIQSQVPRIYTCEKRISSLENDTSILPEIHTLRVDVNKINDQIPIIHETKKIVPVVESNKSRLGLIESKITRLSELDPIKETLGKFEYVYEKLDQISPIEDRVDACEVSIKNVHVEMSDLPIIRDRVSSLENAPLAGDGSLISNISLSHVLSCCNTTDIPIITNENLTASRIFTMGKPVLTSRLGEIKSLAIDSLAEINGYTKANNGTTAGNTGGIAFRTKGLDGNMNVNMTLDGNGKLAIGTHKSHPSALLTLESTTSGVLLPRMTHLQMKKIKNPEIGLLIYNIEDDTLFIHKKTGWTAMC